MILQREIRAVLVLTLVVGGCQDEGERLAEHQSRGDAYLEEEKYAEAVIEYKNVLQLDPNQAAAHYGLAQAYLAARDLRQAYWELQETVRLDPENVDARLKYTQFLVFGGEEELEKAIEQADAVIALEPDLLEAHLLKARALQGLARHDEALAAFERAVETDPESEAALLLLANFHRRQGRREEAEPLYLKLTEVDPSFRSWVAYAGFLSGDPERGEDAEVAYRRALEHASDERRATAVQTLASFYFARERFDEAEQVLKQGLEASEGDLDLIYALARFYVSRGESDKADAMIEEATRAQPDEVGPYLTLSSYRGRQGDPEAALEAAEAALEIDPTHRKARLRKAELLVDMGYHGEDSARIAQGKAIVNAMLTQEPTAADALFVKAKIELAEERTDVAIADLRRAIDTRPDWAQAHFLLGSALYVAGDRLGARAELVRALELDANLRDARKILAQVYAALGEHELSSQEARRVLRETPNDIQTRILLAQNLVRDREYDPALAELEAIPESERSGEMEFALGRTHLLRGDAEKARYHLMRAAEQVPDHPEILSALLELDLAEGRLEESVKRLEEAVERNPESAKLMRVKALAAVAQGRPAVAEGTLRRAIELDPNDLKSYEALARFLARSGRYTEMVATLERALAAQPDRANLNLLVAILYEGQGRTEDALALYEAAIRLDPELGVAKNNLAYILAEQDRQLDRALDLAQEAKSLLPENPNAADTLGWVLYKKSIPSAAIGYLKEAEGGMRPEDPGLATVRHHLALAYEANGEPRKAREVIERALEDLEAQRSAREQQTGQDPGEQAVVVDLRTLLERLPQSQESPTG